MVCTMWFWFPEMWDACWYWVVVGDDFFCKPSEHWEVETLQRQYKGRVSVIPAGLTVCTLTRFLTSCDCWFKPHNDKSAKTDTMRRNMSRGDPMGFWTSWAATEVSFLSAVHWWQAYIHWLRGYSAHMSAMLGVWLAWPFNPCVLSGGVPVQATARKRARNVPMSLWRRESCGAKRRHHKQNEKRRGNYFLLTNFFSHLLLSVAQTIPIPHPFT